MAGVVKITITNLKKILAKVTASLSFQQFYEVFTALIGLLIASDVKFVMCGLLAMVCKI